MDGSVVLLRRLVGSELRVLVMTLRRRRRRRLAQMKGDGRVWRRVGPTATLLQPVAARALVLVATTAVLP